VSVTGSRIGPEKPSDAREEPLTREFVEYINAVLDAAHRKQTEAAVEQWNAIIADARKAAEVFKAPSEVFSALEALTTAVRNARQEAQQTAAELRQTLKKMQEAQSSSLKVAAADMMSSVKAAVSAASDVLKASTGAQIAGALDKLTAALEGQTKAFDAGFSRVLLSTSEIKSALEEQGSRLNNKWNWIVAILILISIPVAFAAAVGIWYLTR
jgi:uncharacterized protein YukE